MHHLPIKSITLHAIGAALLTIGLAISGLVIVLLTIEAQPIDVAVIAAARALLAYVGLLAMLATLFFVGAGSVMALCTLIERVLVRVERGVR